MKTILVGFAVATLSKICADEARDWMGWLSTRLIRWAAHRLPENQERYEEEWLAHANDLPGNIAKLWHAVGCVNAVAQLMQFWQKVAWWTFIYPNIEVAFVLGFVLAIVIEAASIASLGISFAFPHPELSRLRRLRRKAGGLMVLGLNELELRDEDYAYLDLVRELQSDPVMIAIASVMSPQFAGDYYQRRSKFFNKLIFRLFW